MKIKNENDFLGFLISIKDESNNFDVNTTQNASGLYNLDFMYYIDYLTKHQYIRYVDTCTCRLNPSGISAYSPTWKKIVLWIAKLLVLTIKNVIIYVGGILSGVLVAYLSSLLVK